MPPQILEKYNKNVQARVMHQKGQQTRLSLTQNDIETLFKDIHKVQQKSGNKSTAILCGTTVQSNPQTQTATNSRTSKAWVSSSRPASKEPGAGAVATKRRVQSSVPATRKTFRAGDTLGKRDSRLFK